MNTGVNGPAMAPATSYSYERASVTTDALPTGLPPARLPVTDRSVAATPLTTPTRTGSPATVEATTGSDSSVAGRMYSFFMGQPSWLVLNAASKSSTDAPPP